MAFAFVVITALAVVVVALVVVGRVTASLAVEPASSYFDLDAAVLWVGEQLSEETTAQVSYDDVRQVIVWHLDYLADEGVARSDDIEPVASGDVVANEDEALAYVLGRLSAAGDNAPVLTDAQVAEICDAQRAYLVHIGAVGDEATDDEATDDEATGGS
jgi:hypothetical protein